MIEWLKILAIIASIQIALRSIAEVLTVIHKLLDSFASKTETKLDDKIAKSAKSLAKWTARMAWFLGVILGKFGYGTPKLVLDREVKKKVSESTC